MLCLDLVTCYLHRGNEWTNIKYNMNDMKVLKRLRDDKKDINYTKKSVTNRLSQTTNDFFNI